MPYLKHPVPVCPGTECPVLLALQQLFKHAGSSFAAWLCLCKPPLSAPGSSELARGCQECHPGLTGLGEVCCWLVGRVQRLQSACSGKHQHVSCVAWLWSGRWGSVMNTWHQSCCLRSFICSFCLGSSTLAGPVLRGCFGCVRRASEVPVVVLPLVKASVPGSQVTSS